MRDHLVMSAATTTMRRELRPGDRDAIVDLHDRLYRAEHQMEQSFTDGVARTLDEAIAKGWPEGGGVWIVERDDEVAGCLGLGDMGGGLGRLRWVLLGPELRGQGIGRRMVSEAIALARELGFERLELDTFGALRTAAHLYREAGFELTSERRTTMWGPPIAYQRYEMEL